MVKYDYSFREGTEEVVDISQVPLERTKREPYSCPFCKERFTAIVRRPDSDYASFFRHHKGTIKRCSVNHVTETALHYRAKKVIEEEKKIFFPPCVVKLKTFLKEPEFEDLPDWLLARLPKEYTYEPEKVVQLPTVKIEYRISDMVPDVVAYTSDGTYIIEIFVTHRTPPEKVAKAAEFDLHMLEVDLHDLDRTISEEDLRVAIIESWEKTEWRTRPDQEKILATAKEYFLNIAKDLLEKENKRRRRKAEKAKEQEMERLRLEKLELLNKASKKEPTVEVEQKEPSAKKIQLPVIVDTPVEAEDLLGPAKPKREQKTIEWLINENKGDFDRNFPIYDGNRERPRRRYMCVRCDKIAYGPEMEKVRITLNGRDYANKGICRFCARN